MRQAGQAPFTGIEQAEPRLRRPPQSITDSASRLITKILATCFPSMSLPHDAQKPGEKISVAAQFGPDIVLQAAHPAVVVAVDLLMAADRGFPQAVAADVLDGNILGGGRNLDNGLLVAPPAVGGRQLSRPACP